MPEYNNTLLIIILAIMTFLLLRLELRMRRQDQAIFSLLAALGICLKQLDPGRLEVSFIRQPVNITKSTENKSQQTKQK